MSDSLSPDELTNLLSRATEDSSLRPTFLSALLHSTVFFCASSDQLANSTFSSNGQVFRLHDDRQTLSFIELRGRNGQTIPFWTSLDELEQDLHRLKLGEQPYMTLTGLGFLEATEGRFVVLNPGTFAREFSPQQTENLIERGRSELAEFVEYEDAEDFTSEATADELPEEYESQVVNEDEVVEDELRFEEDDFQAYLRQQNQPFEADVDDNADEVEDDELEDEDDQPDEEEPEEDEFDEEVVEDEDSEDEFVSEELEDEEDNAEEDEELEPEDDGEPEEDDEEENPFAFTPDPKPAPNPFDTLFEDDEPEPEPEPELIEEPEPELEPKREPVPDSEPVANSSLPKEPAPMPKEPAPPARIPRSAKAENLFVNVPDAVSLVTLLLHGRSDEAWTMLETAKQKGSEEGLSKALALLLFTSVDGMGTDDEKAKATARLNEASNFWNEWVEWASSQESPARVDPETLHTLSTQVCGCGHSAALHGRYSWPLRDMGIQTTSPCDARYCVCEGFFREP